MALPVAAWSYPAGAKLTTKKNKNSMLLVLAGAPCGYLALPGAVADDMKSWYS